MTKKSATQVVAIEDFREHAYDLWEQARISASEGMMEPLQVGSHLAFCRVLDGNGRPVGYCMQGDATHAVVTVVVKDLGSVPDLTAWDPLCTQKRRSTKNRSTVR